MVRDHWAPPNTDPHPSWAEAFGRAVTLGVSLGIAAGAMLAVVVLITYPHY